MKKSKIRLALSLSLLILLGLSVMGQAATVTVASSGEPTTLDPQATFNGYSFLITNQIFETLVRKDDNEFLPQLATSWEMIDETTWRFHLREGVRFHNGDKFDASSVKFSIERLIDPKTQATGAFVLSAVSEVKVIDDYTVDIITDKPFAPLLAHLTHPVTAIINKTAVTTYGEDVGQHPIGTGPFIFQHWSSGDDVTLLSNNDYWDGAPNIDNLVIRVIPEVSTQLVELQSGSVDIMFHVPPDHLQSLERNSRIDVQKELGWGSTFVGFNTQSGPTSNQLVRQAIAHAIDTDSIVTQLRNGMAVEAISMIPETIWGAYAGLDDYEYDPDKASDLLEQAGYENGLKLELVVYQNSELEQLAQALQFLLGNIGIDLSVQVMDYGAYAATTASGETDLFLSGWGTVTLDADYTLYALLHSSEIPDNNISFYSNNRVDTLLETGRSTADATLRQQAYQEVQEIVHQELPMFTVYYPLFSYAKNTRLQGEALPYSWINLDLSNAWIE